VPLQDIHYDPTHLLFTGAYESAQARAGVMDRSGEEVVVRSDDNLAAAHITKGELPMMRPKVR